MALTYLLAPMPKWYIADLTGKPLGGGSMYTFSSENPTVQKFVYQDPAGNFPWPDPVLFDENGSQGPLYWQVDSSDPQNTYYVEVYDAQGVLQWTIDNFVPPGTGGGGSVTEVVSVNNLLVNNVMYRNVGASASPSNVTFLKLALGAHDGLSNNVANSAGLYTGPDICFVKNNTNASDQLQFLPFTPLGINALNSDETPYEYLNYSCTNMPSGEIVKCVQFPVTRRVQNLSNLAVMITIWARCNSGNNSLKLYWLQFFGDGSGASTAVNPLIFNINTLTTNWQQFVISATVPSVTGKTLGAMGACGNDALFLQMGYPLGQVTNIDFTKPCLYLGIAAPTTQYTPYDQINAVMSSPRTGYIESTFHNIAPWGYLLMDDGTIGSAASGATSNGGRGASVDSFALYCLIWNNVSNPTSNAYAPVTGGLGTSAVADFTANKPMQLPLALGRVLAGSGTGAGLSAWALGLSNGAETVTLTTAQIPAHTHPEPGANFIVDGAYTFIRWVRNIMDFCCSNRFGTCWRWWFASQYTAYYTR